MKQADKSKPAADERTLGEQVMAAFGTLLLIGGAVGAILGALYLRGATTPLNENSNPLAGIGVEIGIGMIVISVLGAIFGIIFLAVSKPKQKN